MEAPSNPNTILTAFAGCSSQSGYQCTFFQNPPKTSKTTAPPPPFFFSGWRFFPDLPRDFPPLSRWGIEAPFCFALACCILSSIILGVVTPSAVRIFWKWGLGSKGEVFCPKISQLVSQGSRGGVRNRSPFGPRNSFDKFFLREKGSERRMRSSFLSSPCQNKVVRWLGEESVERERGDIDGI